MTTERKVLRKLKRAALATALLAFSGCLAPTPPVASTPAVGQTPPPSRFEATNPPAPPVRSPAQDGPVEIAEQILQLNRIRLSQVPTDPQFNGYLELSRLKTRPSGILALSQLRTEKGPEAFKVETAKWLNKKDSSLVQDISDIKKALHKPTVSANLAAQDTGLVEVPSSAEYEKVVSALGTLPFLYEQFPEADDRLYGYLFALDVGRKLAFQAAVWEHYRLGLEIEESALEHIQALLRDRSQSSAKLARAAIPRLQGQTGGPQEMLGLLDNEYFLATRRLQTEVSSPEALPAERLALAARFLKARESYLSEAPPESGFQTPATLPELAGSKWAVSQPDYLEYLGRSRRTATQLSAAELIAALEACRAEKGMYPEKLEELVPGYLTRIPPDNLTQEGHFLYESDGKKYRLRSRPTGKIAQEILW